MKTRVVYLVDAGTGNIRSVGRALTLSGADVRMVKTPEELLPGRVVLPAGNRATSLYFPLSRSASLPDM